MPEIDNLVYDLVNKHEVFADAFFVEDAAVIPEDFHHAVDDIEHAGGLHIVLAGGDEVDAELLGEEVIDAVDVLPG